MRRTNKSNPPSEQKQAIPRKEWHEIVNSCAELTSTASNALYDIAAVFIAVSVGSQASYRARLKDLQGHQDKDDLIVRWLADAFMHIADDGTNMALSRVASDIFDALDNETPSDCKPNADLTMR